MPYPYLVLQALQQLKPHGGHTALGGAQQLVGQLPGGLSGAWGRGGDWPGGGRAAGDGRWAALQVGLQLRKQPAGAERDGVVAAVTRCVLENNYAP